ncbi:MAG TPA: DUF2085 domain-containing protein [Anaerolineaceae bacterium]|nr:DUF2085 domain-containing protein [Anaerolineaceae bacterium]
MVTLPLKLSASPIWKALVVILGVTLLVVWGLNTPSGLLGKADSIAYAVCHRIDSHTFHLGDREIPLCARCSGMYLGALLGIAYQLARGRYSSIPPRKILAFFAVLFALFGLDGVNSYLHFFPQAPQLYPPQNWLRLTTGTGMGLAVSAVILPVFHQSVWTNAKPGSALGSWRALAGLLALAAVMDLLFASENPLVLYPLALLSAAGVLILLGMVYTLIWVMLFRAENRFQRWSQLWFPLTGGLVTALLQVALFDLGRFWLTGTWSGFNL